MNYKNALLANQARLQNRLKSLAASEKLTRSKIENHLKQIENELASMSTEKAKPPAKT